jgi:hypothetical protein
MGRGRQDTWFSMQIQVYVNGHEWLERKLMSNKISFTKHENVFFRIGDWKRAQKLADRSTSLDWKMKLERYARFVNSLLNGILHESKHHCCDISE